jgi:RHS repeat-associated protein
VPDLHGNVVAVATSAGAWTTAYRYDAYGETVDVCSGSITSPWRFQGRILESASGSTDLYDFSARSYDPSLGAFTSFDSVSGSAVNPLTLNRYLYANANPATLVDPDGHWACKLDREDCAEMVRQKKLDRILHDYQVDEDPVQNVIWHPHLDFFFFHHRLTDEDKDVNITGRERDLLDTLPAWRWQDINNIKTAAQDAANQGQVDHSLRIKADGDNDGHADALRHAYASALLTQSFGADFTEQFTTAHEGVKDNAAAREAMDLYNNSIGRQIAIEHPRASPEELKTAVLDAINSGRMVVIDKDHQLQFSNSVAWGKTGSADPKSIIDAPPGSRPPDPTAN